MKKNDIILILALLVCGLLTYAGFVIYQDLSTEQGIVEVRIDGEEYATFSLSEDVTHKLEFANGGYNIFRIQGGKVQVIEASCPDKICVNHRPVDKNGQSIVCLPNKLVISVKNGLESDVDIFTN